MNCRRGTKTAAVIFTTIEIACYHTFVKHYLLPMIFWERNLQKIVRRLQALNRFTFGVILSGGFIYSCALCFQCNYRTGETEAYTVICTAND
jgi:hypothetical protein